MISTEGSGEEKPSMEIRDGYARCNTHLHLLSKTQTQAVVIGTNAKAGIHSPHSFAITQIVLVFLPEDKVPATSPPLVFKSVRTWGSKG